MILVQVFFRTFTRCNGVMAKEDALFRLLPSDTLTDIVSKCRYFEKQTPHLSKPSVNRAAPEHFVFYTGLISNMIF